MVLALSPLADDAGPAALSGLTGGLRTDGLVLLLAALALVAHAAALTSPADGWSPLVPRWRHVLLPGPAASPRPPGRPSRSARCWGTPRRTCPCCRLGAVLATLLVYGVVLVRLAPSRPHAVPEPVRAVARDVAVPGLAGLLVTTAVVAAVPVLDALPVEADALPWLALGLAVVVTAAVVVRRAALPGGLLVAARDVVLPLAAAGSGLLLLVALRPLTGLPVEVESLVVGGAAVLVHVGRAAAQRARGAVVDRPTLRDVSTATATTSLGVLGVLAADAGARPLWVPGLTWLLAGAGACALAALVGGRPGTLLPGAPRHGPGGRCAWAPSGGWPATRSLVVDVDGPLDRLTVPLGLVMAALGAWALLEPARPGHPPRGQPRGARARARRGARAGRRCPPSLDPEGLRPLVVALAGTGLVLAGGLLRWRAPLLVGLLVDRAGRGRAGAPAGRERPAVGVPRRRGRAGPRSRGHVRAAAPAGRRGGRGLARAALSRPSSTARDRAAGLCPGSRVASRTCLQPPRPAAVPLVDPATLDEQAREVLRRLTARADADFREDQLEAVRALLVERSRVLVVQRTGWGKSAVYFVATALLRAAGAGPTVIVSPLLVAHAQPGRGRRAGRGPRRTRSTPATSPSGRRCAPGSRPARSTSCW